MPQLSKVGSEMLDGALPALDGSSLTGVGVDGVTSSADATAITIDSSENVAIGSTTGLATATHHTLQVGGDDTYQRLSLNNTGTGGNHWAIHSVNGAGGSAAGKFGVYLSPSWRMTIDASGNVGIGVTAPTQKLDVNGTVKASSVAFPATQVASADANTLDDYEEGTFTTGCTFGSGSSTIHSQESTYVKIGKLVTIAAFVRMGTASSPSGHWTITGLPFTGVSQTYFSVILWNQLGSATQSSFFGQYSGGTSFKFWEATNSTGRAGSPGAYADSSDGPYCGFNFTYLTS